MRFIMEVEMARTRKGKQGKGRKGSTKSSTKSSMKMKDEGERGM
jgi:hypothetical protein